MKILKLTLPALAVSLSAHAFAQPSPAVPGSNPVPPTVQENIGFPVGEKSRLHANLDLGIDFDTNPERLPDKNPDGSTNAAKQSATRALIRPSVALDVPGSTYKFNLAAGLTIGQFFATGSRSAQTDFGGDVGVNAQVGDQESAVAFRMRDMLARTPTYLSQLGAGAADERRFEAWTNRGEAIVTFRPGGRALDLDFGYLNTLYIYDHLPQSQQHGALFEAKLRFLPKTAFVFHSDISFFSTGNEGMLSTGSDQVGGPTRKSTPYNLSLGIVGQVTERLSAQLMAGFGDSLTWNDGFFSGGTASDNQRNFIATANFGYAISDSALITLGYQRKVMPVIVLDSYLENSLQGRVVWGIGRLSLGLFGQYSFISYSKADASPQLLIGDVRAEYWFTDYLTGAVDYRVLTQMHAPPPPAMPGASALLLEEFARHQFFVMLGVHY